MVKPLANESTKLSLNHGAAFSLPMQVKWQLWLSQFVTILTLSAELTSWMLALLALCLLWLAAINNSKLANPPRLLVVLLAIAGAIAIALSGKTLGLLLAMVHLICFSYVIKGLEINQRRDFYQLVLLGLFLQSCALIFQHSIGFSFLILLVIIFNLSVLYRYFSVAKQANSSIIDTAKILLYSLPLAIGLFVLFPKLSPFWQVPLAKTAKTGLSSSVSPGDVAKLAQSEELAFRVELDKPIAISQMYWRAMTLSYYDGRAWRRAKTNQGRAQRTSVSNQVTSNYYQLKTPVSTQGRQISYQVIAEPSQQNWLFALDVAQTRTPDIRQLYDYSLISAKPVTQTISYQVTSYLDAPLSLEGNSFWLARNSIIDSSANPKLFAEGQRLKQALNDPEAIIKAVMERFSQQNYFYTLEPPRLINNSLDQFYFETKSGFCEHYASSFTYLMRAAGIPARLVTGYLGAQYNEKGNYYSVYQYDAHAWSEVWLAGKGWVRVDPTAAVSPSRVIDGMSASLRNSELASDSLFSFNTFKSMALIAQLKLQFEALDYQWTRLIIGYSVEDQYQLLSKVFGSGILWKAALVLFLIFIAVISWLWWLDKRIQSIKYRYRWQKYYAKSLIELEKLGIKRSPEHTIEQFSIIVNQELSGSGKKQLAIAFTQLSCLIEKCVYQSLSEIELSKNQRLLKTRYSQFNQALKISTKAR